MKALAAACKKLTPAEGGPAERMAAARNGSIDLDGLDGDANGDESSADTNVDGACQQHGASRWSISTPMMPLNPKLFCEPIYSEQLAH